MNPTPETPAQLPDEWLANLAELSEYVALPLKSVWHNQQHTLYEADGEEVLEHTYACSYSEMATLSQTADTSQQDYLREAANAVPILLADRARYRQQVADTLRGLLKPMDGYESSMGGYMELSQAKAHNILIVSAASTLGIDLSSPHS